MYICVFFHRKRFNDLAWSVFASLEEDQYIFDAEGVEMAKHCIEGKESRFYIQCKKRRKLNPGSLVFLLGNTLHAGSHFEGDEVALQKKMEGVSSHHHKNVGDLKLFFDVDGKLPHQKAGGSRTEQLWCFESGNLYRKRAGFTDNKSVDRHVNICDKNDACDENDDTCYQPK